MTLFACWLDGGRTGNGKGKNKCGGLSTAQQTMKLSVSPVEMTQFLVTVTDLLTDLAVYRMALAAYRMLLSRWLWLLSGWLWLRP
jgi:hypothetical protein